MESVGMIPLLTINYSQPFFCHVHVNNIQFKNVELYMMNFVYRVTYNKTLPTFIDQENLAYIFSICYFSLSLCVSLLWLCLSICLSLSLLLCLSLSLSLSLFLCIVLPFHLSRSPYLSLSISLSHLFLSLKMKKGVFLAPGQSS